MSDYSQFQNSSFTSSNASFETGTEKFTKNKLYQMLVSLEDAVNHLGDDILYMKNMQESQTDKSNRDFQEKKNDLSYLMLQSGNLSQKLTQMDKSLEDTKLLLESFRPEKIKLRDTSTLFDIKNEALTNLANNIKSQYENRIKQINSLQFSNENLTKINMQLKVQIMNKEKELNKELICSNCKEKYKINNNTENSCIYHPGEIKYYSCKGCGCDEYYTCCSKCAKCSLGCKKGKHLTKKIIIN